MSDPNDGHPTQNTEPEEFLVTEMNRLRDSGTDLCVAALRVVNHGDGLHRLAAACAVWCDTLATEFGRLPSGAPATQPVERKDGS